MREPLFEALKELAINPDNVLLEFMPGDRWREEITTNCLCGETIIERCEIIHIPTKKRYIVGNMCINYFGIKPLCEKCGIYQSKSSTAKYCIECHGSKKLQKPTGYILLNKYRGFTYDQILKGDPGWCNQVLDDEHNKINDIHFYNWLLLKRKLDEIPNVEPLKPEPQANRRIKLKKYDGEKYEDVLKKDPDYCKWVRDKMDSKYDPDFKKWLIKITEEHHNKNNEQKRT